MTLDRLLELRDRRVVGHFHFPVDEDVPDFDPDWVRDIVLGQGTEDEKTQAILDHRYLKEGELAQYTIGDLGLPMLVFEDEGGTPLMNFKELVFDVGHGYVTYPRSLPSDINQMISKAKYSRSKIFGREVISAQGQDVVLDNFQKYSFGPNSYAGRKNRIQAERKFSDGLAILDYSASMNPGSQSLDRFMMQYYLFPEPQAMAQFGLRVEVEMQEGEHIPHGWIFLGRMGEGSTYHFDEEGVFSHVKPTGKSMTLHRAQMEGREAVLQNYPVLETMPDNYLAHLQGLRSDLWMLQKYQSLVDAFNEHEQTATPLAQMQLDYAATLKQLSSLQYEPLNTVPGIVLP